MNALKTRFTHSAQSTFWLLLIAWLVINLLQAWLTGMSSDESYYALWGQHLAWGYFDHPPLVALFNYLSAQLAWGNLGVRLITVLAQGVTLWLVWKTIGDKQATSQQVVDFFILAASLVMFAALGFITTPDAPLLLFAALFLWAYKRFLEKESWLNTLVIGVAMAGMVYSKYQSVLVIGFVVLSNLKLLVRGRFWLAGFFGLFLLIPHFYWQYSHDFPSFQYHLVDRNNAFKWRYFFEFLPNQLAVFNPFTFGLLVYVLLRVKTVTVFERGLMFLIVGFIVFFWIMALRGHVEPHWTVVVSVAILPLLYGATGKNPKVRRFVRRWVLGSLGLIVLVRLAMVVPAVAGRIGYNNKPVYKAIEAVAGDTPVVFRSSFQNPSMYAFFTGKQTTTISTVYNRRTQFDLWQWERSLEGKPVFVCVKMEGRSKKFKVGDQSFEGFFLPAFRATGRLVVTAVLPTAQINQPGDTLTMQVSVYNPYPHRVNFMDTDCPLRIAACLFTKKVKVLCDVAQAPDIGVLKPGETYTGTWSFVVPPIKPGKYALTVTTESLFGPMLGNNLYTWTIE